ncbi:hypothetical protein DRP04_11590 [Archaeoglobales archaeon]|nr:MAG: hypothetical protein DRP04_11590 [Archaeoglobales archaeon]
MKCGDIIKALKEISKYFICEEFENFVLIETPFEYPDGDPIQLYFLRDPDGKIVLSDFGETLSYLSTSRFDLFSSKRREKVLSQILRSANVKLRNGELRIEDPEDLVNSIIKLTETCLRIGDLIYSHRIRGIPAFKEQVSGFLLENDVKFIEDFQTEGSSGSKYRVDFYLYVEPPGLLQTLSSRSEGYADVLISKTFTMWYDLKEKDGRCKYLTLIDDTRDVWKQTKLGLLGRISDIYYWSKKEELLEVLLPKL